MSRWSAVELTAAAALLGGAVTALEIGQPIAAAAAAAVGFVIIGAWLDRSKP